MDKLQRKKAEIFAGSAAASEYGIAQFGSLAAGTPTFSTDTDVIQALPAYKQGWHDAVVADQSPAMEDRNAVDYVNSRQIAYILQQGIAEWLSTETYHINAYVVGSDGLLYRSVANNNLNHEPTTDIAGDYWEPFKSGGSSFPLFYHTFADHLLNDASWLRADTFSWQSGAVYKSAYQHLVADIAGKTAQTETISGTTITFYRADDGHKIVLAAQESNVSAIYNTTGVAWYYILDTANTRFKLPRSKWAFTGLRDTVGNYVAPGLPGHSHSPLYIQGSSDDNGDQGNYVLTDPGAHWGTATNQGYTGGVVETGIYGNSTTVQPPATQMYLYFYVGNTVQDQTTIDVGEITEALNDKADASALAAKADTDLANVTATGSSTAAGWAMPSSVYESWNVPASGSVFDISANGYLYIGGASSNNSNYHHITIFYSDTQDFGGPMLRVSNDNPSARLAVLAPVLAGQRLCFIYSGCSVDVIKFIYAEGSKSEAN